MTKKCQKKRIFTGAAVLCAMAQVAFAQSTPQYEVVYNEPTKVNLGGRPVVADIKFVASREEARTGVVQLGLITDVTPFVEETAQDLENWIATNQERCGERWGASAPKITFPKGAIRFQLDLELEVWNCGVRGKAEPSRIANESGSIDVTLDPYVAQGKLQARLQAFSIDDRSGVSKYLPLEFVVQRVLKSEIEKLNENPKFYRAPSPLLEEGFVYKTIRGQENDNKRIVISVRYVADGSEGTIDRVIDSIRTDGITQKKR